jgi:soluble lytic murein transglycosylase-like protein
MSAGLMGRHLGGFNWLVCGMLIYVSGDIYRPVTLVSKLLGVDQNLVFSIISVESGFDKKAYSRAGAIGLMQVMPKNIKHLGARKESYIENIICGALLLKDNLRRFSGNISLSLASYNAGPTAVLRYKGIPPFKETRKYVSDVLRAWRKNRYVCE